MMVRVLAALLFVLPLAAHAAGKAPPSKAPAAKGEAPKAAAPEADVGEGGKSIEFDADGNPREVKAPAKEAKKEEPLKKGEISEAESCKLQTTAQCGLLKRCAAGTGLEGMFPCEQMIAQCAAMTGKAPYLRKDAEACAKGIAAKKCESKFDPMNPGTLNPAAEIPACKPLLGSAPAAAGKGSEFSKPSTDFSKPGTDFGSDGAFGKTIEVNGNE